MFWFEVWFNGDRGKRWFCLCNVELTVVESMELVSKARSALGISGNSTYEFTLNPAK